MQQSPSIARLSGTFVRVLIGGLYPLLIFQALQKYCQNQGIITPSIVVGLLSLGINALLNYFFIYLLNLGFIGSPMATDTTRFFLPLIMWLYIYKKGLHKKTWFGWTREAISWKRVSMFLKFAIPGGAMILFEVWGFDSSTLVAGSFKDPVAVSAHAVTFGFLATSFMFPLALSIGKKKKKKITKNKFDVMSKKIQ